MSHMAFNFKANFLTFLYRDFSATYDRLGSAWTKRKGQQSSFNSIATISEVLGFPAEAHLLHVWAEGVGTQRKMFHFMIYILYIYVYMISCQHRISYNSLTCTAKCQHLLSTDSALIQQPSNWRWAPWHVRIFLSPIAQRVGRWAPGSAD